MAEQLMFSKGVETVVISLKAPDRALCYRCRGQTIYNLHLVAHHRAANDHLVAADDNNMLASKELLGNNRGKAAKKVVASVNDNRGHGCRGFGEEMPPHRTCKISKALQMVMSRESVIFTSLGLVEKKQ